MEYLGRRFGCGIGFQRIVESHQAGTAGLLIINTASFSVILRVFRPHRRPSGIQSKRGGEQTDELALKQCELTTIQHAHQQAVVEVSHLKGQIEAQRALLDRQTKSIETAATQSKQSEVEKNSLSELLSTTWADCE